MKMLSLILFYSVLHVIVVSGECPGGCGERTLVYDDIRCKPIYASETDCCPSHFDCSHIETEAKIKDKCHFHGKLYSPGESVDNKDIYGNCNVGCICAKTQEGRLEYICAELDCPEGFTGYPPPPCYLGYQLDECCSSGRVCPPFNHTCKAGDKVYHEGERFDHPHEKCTSCVCSEGFESGKCLKKKCTEEILNRKDIENFCAPSYRTQDLCCPWSWICAEESDTIVASKTTSKHPELKCKHGKRELNIGDSFTRADKTYGGTVACECRIPPLLTCIHTFNTPSQSSRTITKTDG